MFRKVILPLLAVAGIGLGIYAAARSAKTIPPAQPVSEASQPPYKNFVAGAGIVEASTENIAVGTHMAGIVSKIYVQIGACVKAAIRCSRLMTERRALKSRRVRQPSRLPRLMWRMRSMR